MTKVFAWIHRPELSAKIIVILGVLVYLNAIPSKWAVDDSVVIHQNQLVQRGVTGIPDIFAHDFLFGTLGESSQTVAGNRWRPLTPAMYAVFSEVLAKPKVKNAQTGEVQKDHAGHVLNDLSDDTTFPYFMHALNVALFGLLCWVLYRFLLLIFAHLEQGKLLAFYAAALFAVHPIHTEAVANVKGSDEILALLFSLLAAGQLFRAFTREANKKIQRLMVGVVCFFLGLLSKENTVVFVAIIPLTLWFFGMIPVKKAAISALVVLLPLAVYLPLRISAIGSDGFSQPPVKELMNNPFLVLDKNVQFKPLLEGSDVLVLQHPSNESFREMPFANKMATNVFTAGLYLKLLLVPHPLTIDYYPRHIAVKSFADAGVLLALLANLLLLFLAVKGTKSRSVHSYGIWFYFLSFSIVSNFVFPIGTNMGERFMFIPSVGLLIAFVFGLIFLAEKLKKPVLAPAVTLVAVLFFSGLTVARNADWRDHFTLVSHDVNVSKNSAKIKADYAELVLNRLGKLHMRAKAESRSLNAQEKSELDSLLRSALPHLRDALAVDPMYGLVWMDLGRVNQELGDNEETHPNERLRYIATAVAAFQMTDTYQPGEYKKELPKFKSMCYASLAKLYGQQFGAVDQAIAYLHMAEQTDSTNNYVKFLLGTAYDLKGDAGKAGFYTQAAYRSDTLNRDYIENYALICQKQVKLGQQPPAALAETERLLLKVKVRNNGLESTNPEKKSLTLRTLNLLLENYTLSKQPEKEARVKKEIEALGR